MFHFRDFRNYTNALSVTGANNKASKIMIILRCSRLRNLHPILLAYTLACERWLSLILKHKQRENSCKVQDVQISILSVPCLQILGFVCNWQANSSGCQCHQNSTAKRKLSLILPPTSYSLQSMV